LRGRVREKERESKRVALLNRYEAALSGNKWINLTLSEFFFVGKD